MGFLQQINLLTRKNLKIRFTHKCLSLFELYIPILITVTIGLIVSYSTGRILRYGHGGSKEADLPEQNETKEETVDQKFLCGQNYYAYMYSESQVYMCETRYDFVNNLTTMEQVKRLKVEYIVAEKVVKQGKDNLVESIMSSILGLERSSTNSWQRSKTNWTRSAMTEKQLEVCVMQQHPHCQDLFAAIIIESVEDGVNRDKKFTIQYKIRMTDRDRNIWQFYTDRLFADFNGDNFRTTIEGIEQIYFTGRRYQEPSAQSEGFVTIQAFLDRGIMAYIKSKLRNHKFEQVQVSLVRMPFVRPAKDSYITRVISLLYSLLGSLTIFSVMQINSEKYSGFKELLRMHGVTNWTQWMGWLFTNFLVYSIWAFLMTFFLCIPILLGPNALPMMGIDCFLYWLLLLLFMMSITTYCFLVSTFFEKVWTAASIGLVTWIMLTVIMMVVSTDFISLTKWAAMGLMLVPPVAFDFCFRIFLYGGGSFQTMGKKMIENVPITTLHCLFMLLLDNVIFMTLAMYLDNVLPAKYGVRKSPFYFLRDATKFLLRKTKRDSDYKSKCEDEEESVEMTSEISHDPNRPFESDPEHVEAAVVIRNLKKEFKRKGKRAVDGLNAKMYTGEIYALLGFNGAGKTTTIGVLTGLTAPTDGAAKIFDLDIRKDMEEIRKYIGLCPQHNLLFDQMSVLEQVAFFGKLKGIDDALGKAKELLTWLGMQDKLYNKPEEISGGQKRRVHLAIALIGDTKLAFLDEPTSGLDPESRRGVWDILLKLRGKTTVILTTHIMEEADTLGDRIGIMSEGKMVCSGTSSFLKKYYGVGYNLKMSTMDSECEPEKVCTFIRDFVPNANLNISGHSTIGPLDSVSISLPTTDLDLSKVADLMEALRKSNEQLRVENIGLSLSSMDEVFLKVGEAVHAVPVTLPTSCDPSTNNVSGSRYVGSKLQWYRFRTLLFKRMMYFVHAPFTLLSLILFFSAMLWIILTSLSSAVNRIEKQDPPRLVSSNSLSSYNSPIALLHDSDIVSGQHNADILYSTHYLLELRQGGHGIEVEEWHGNTTFQQIMSSLKNASVENLHHYRQDYLVGASFNSTGYARNATGFFSTYALHSAPLSLNLISQSMIKRMFGVDATINVVNYPFKRSLTYGHITLSHASSTSDRLYYSVKCGGAMILVVITSLLTGTAALLPTEERLNKGKQLQLMTGASPFIYWMAMFTWDFLFFSFVNVVITLIYVLADYTSGNWIFTNNGAGAVIFLILECHSFAALWFSYLVSWAPCIKTASDSFLIVNKLAVLIGIIWNVFRHILLAMTDFGRRIRRGTAFEIVVYYFAHIFGYITSPFPMYSLFQAMMKLGTVSIPNSVCNWFPEDVLHLSCDLAGARKREEGLFMHSCCENCKINCFKPQPYFNMSHITLFEDYQDHSMIFDILTIILSGVFYAGVLFSLEYILPLRNVRDQLKKISSNSTVEGAESLSSSIQDEDVTNEAARVEDIVKDNALEAANHALITHNLQLEFGELKAVNGMSFGVYPGECFGLLGVNGAGKTSTFRIITGDIFPSAGNMFSGGINYYQCRASYLSSLGYCPQFDGIIGSLTGLQMVKLYGALRGIPPGRVTEDAKIWLDKFGLLGSASKQCGKYSGGMKRRLSAAMAMIGSPKLLLLDEPTTGVDPAFRRQFWNVIREIKGSGQSILLTSHTMDECEALCTRLGIMVDGQFKCLGNIQHLKSKHGTGYTLTVKLKRSADEREHEEKIKFLTDEILGEISPCIPQTKQMTLLQYRILSKSLWYSDIFRIMERIRNMPESREIIDEYSVTETSLEDVFISFATKKQRQ